MADEHWLDRLSRALARGVSRKEFLRLLGSAALAAFAPLGSPLAHAQRRPCSEGCLNPLPDCCGEFCTNFDIDASNCGGCGEQFRCGAGQICRGRTCVTPERPPTPTPLRCEPPCGPGQVCLTGAEQPFCCAEGLACNNICYESPPRRCDGWCCLADQSCCPTATAGYCCEPGSTCLPDSLDPEGGSPCCPGGRVCINQCCRGETECINGRCWPKCNPACAGGQFCLEPGDPDSGRPPVCCAAELVWDVGASPLCCPPQDRWVHAVGYGGLPECCPESDRWEEGGQCCPPERRPDPRFTCCEPGMLAAADRNDPTSRICCHLARECNGVCCDYLEECLGGICQPYQRDGCPEPCGPERICCSDAERCEQGRCVPRSLSGIWLDESLGAEVQIAHSGNAVTSTYLEQRACDHRDGTGNKSYTDFSFAGTIEGNQITGETSACNYGEDNPLGVGWTRTQIRLTIAEDWKTLSGHWFNQDRQDWLPLSFRKLRDEQGQPVGGRGPSGG